ncbi:beta-1,4-galactosyltransferase 1 [Gallus gallus]|uniref:Beta-1,4-galactosyltransferase n=1 Tax=Gallus gallus TaxID=9031 RepID=Q92074_CHICK|nr:beta-1,4-galactosyltransferase 1 [Gallus gallus]AAB05218.1 beta-1,4-galactosyltransferase [Gallus gallus]ACO58511.1 beta-1,4-galactosyltransferase 1 [synthetic construct]|eukprot:NP_990533.1 beta-1,4-galactosyltransferase 1 [Gallus gallus]
MKEPALPGTSLQRACRLLVAFCALHLSATLLYYLAGSSLTPPRSPEPPPRRPPPANLSLPPSRPPPPPAARPRPGPVSAQPRNLPDSAPSGLCPDPSPLLVGPLRVEFSQPVNLEEVASTNPEVREGGRFAPKDCKALQKVAIIIPFRNREEHLKYWLYYMHPILQRQQLDYGVYVINQDGDEEFNRAKLLNVGFTEALKEYDYDCFVFSDVDLIPMDDRNTYKCYSQPRHLSVSMDKFGFRLPYNQYFGGVSALSKEQFTKINGFPNNYWGWGGEDDDIYNRLVFKGMGISRPDAVIGKCRMIRHSRDRKNEPNPERFDRIAHTRETMSSDGLNSLSYEVLRTDRFPLYTRITVDIGAPGS